MSKPKPVQAAVALKEWLDAKGESQGSFAERTGIDRVRLLRIINGHTKRISADVAARVVQGTKGGVPLEKFRSSEHDAA